MGRATTLLEGLCGHAMSLGAQSMEVEYKDGREWVMANKGAVGISIANYKSSSADAKELRGNLYAAVKKPVRTVIRGQVYILKVGIFDSFGRDAFAVSIISRRSSTRRIHRYSPPNRVNIWPSSTTTPRSMARLPRNRIWNATSGFSPRGSRYD